MSDDNKKFIGEPTPELPFVDTAPRIKRNKALFIAIQVFDAFLSYLFKPTRP